MYRIGPIGRKSNLHYREKCLIGLVLATLCLLCFAGIFLLPDNFGSERVLRVYKQFQKAGPEIFIPAPPLAMHGSKDNDPHFLDDRQKLEAKIKEELGEILDRPQLQQNQIANDESPQQADDNDQQQQGAAPPHLDTNGVVIGTSQTADPTHNDDLPVLDNNNLPVGNVNIQLPLGGHADNDAAAEEKRIKIKEVRDFKICFEHCFFLVSHIITNFYTFSLLRLQKKKKNQKFEKNFKLIKN
ncbi:mannosyl-oligosaccharide alpha-1,2-mannosidase IA-like isoform 1-T1 [Glossina fuscipes fuscipes]